MPLVACMCADGFPKAEPTSAAFFLEGKHSQTTPGVSL